MVLWLIGISGAGKTTIGRKLEEHFKEQGRHCYLIDGDAVRTFFENDLGYSTKAREMNIKRIIFGAHLLDANNVLTIVCNISPFERLREFARRKVSGYVEIYLKKQLEISMKNDVKGVYREAKGQTDLIGIDIKFEEPLHSDLVLEVDKQTEAETFDAVIKYLEKVWSKAK